MLRLLSSALYRALSNEEGADVILKEKNDTLKPGNPKVL